jgi:hypothetical protein
MITRLLQSLRDVQACSGVEPDEAYTPPFTEVERVLTRQNGFYAYKRGLHVLGRCRRPVWHSLERWNDPVGWVSSYGKLASGLFFFAEDAFGNQFAWDGRAIIRFLAETGEREEFAPDIEKWLERIVSNPAVELGLAVLDDWIRVRDLVPEGKHLFPRTPLVAGGSTHPSEIVLLDPFENMAFKGSFARQIADVPDGTRIEIVIDRPPSN